MNREIIAVDLYCENLDWIRIPYEYVDKLEIFENRRNDAEEVYDTQVELILKPAADTDAASFEEDVHCIDSGEGTLFERLQIPDLTLIGICYSDQTSMDYNVMWEDEENDGYRNRHQRVTVRKDGSLTIRICEKV